VDKTEKIGVGILVVLLLTIIVQFLYFSSQHTTADQTASCSGELIAQPQSSLRELLTGELEANAAWLLRNQTAAGDFNYQRLIATGEIVAGRNNIVRQSGTLYGIAKLYNYSRDQRYLDALLKGFAYFDTIAQTKIIEDTTIRYFDYDGIIQSNTVALQLLAYLEWAQSVDTIPSKQRTSLNEMANFIVLSQREDGSFDNYFLNPTPPGEAESDYNNGESFLALVRMYTATDDQSYLDAIERSTPYLIAKYKDLNLQFFLWGTTAFAELYERTDDRSYYDYIVNQTELLLAQPERYQAITSFLFSCTTAKPGYSQIVYTEGLLPIYRVVAEDNPELANRLRAAIVTSIIFHILFQSPPADTLPADVYALVRGGSCTDTSCESQRIDNVQHGVSVYVDALAFFDTDYLDTPCTSALTEANETL
jgi:hypothetical protein